MVLYFVLDMSFIILKTTYSISMCLIIARKISHHSHRFFNKYLKEK